MTTISIDLKRRRRTAGCSSFLDLRPAGSSFTMMILVLLPALILYQTTTNIEAFTFNLPNRKSIMSQLGSTNNMNLYPFHISHRRSFTLSSSYDPDAEYEEGNEEENDGSQSPTESQEEHNYDTEETLLVMHLAPLDGVNEDDALSKVSQYTQSFPFAAVLPVQPLQYLPTDDGGVELRFLRKKTHIKPGIDGGIRFFVTTTTPSSSSSELNAEDRDDDDEDEEDEGLEDGTIVVTAKRNSKGQSLSKMFAEKLVITTLVQGMLEGAKMKAGGDGGGGGGNDGGSAASTIQPPKTRIESPTANFVATRSVFHKWM
jgi:hypothetical protein